MTQIHPLFSPSPVGVFELRKVGFFNHGQTHRATYGEGFNVMRPMGEDDLVNWVDVG